MDRHIYRWTAALLMVLTAGLWMAAPVNAKWRERDQVLTRSFLWASFRSHGAQGRKFDFSKTEDSGLAYPGHLIRGPARDGGYRYNWNTGWAHRVKVSIRFTSSNGEGTWILTNLNGDINVSSSGPRYLTQDIVPMVYDASAGPEMDLGYANEWGKDIYEPDGGNSNYWPGGPAATGVYPTEIHNYRYYDYMERDKDHWPEEMVICRWTTERGVTATSKAYAWSYPGYNHFFIKEYVFENTGDTDGDGVADIAGGGHQLNDTYFALANGFSVSESGYDFRSLYSYHRQRDFVLDETIAFTEAGNYNGPGAGEGLKLVYQHDGDYPLSADDDEGQPYIASIAFAEVQNVHKRPEGMFQSFPYIGVAPIAVGTSDLPFNSRDAGEGYIMPKENRQPHTVKTWKIHTSDTYEEPTNARHSDADMYGMVTDGVWMDNPAEVAGWTNTETYGPYDMAPGDKVKIVVAYVGGAGSQFAGPGGAEMDFLEWARGIGVGNKAQLRKGADAIVANTKAALKLYHEYEYDLPDPPPDIAITAVSNPQGNLDITWSAAAENAEDPDYEGAEARDVAGYRVYRATQGNLGPWRLLTDIKVGGPYPAGASYDPDARWLRQDQVNSDTPIAFDEPGVYRFADATAQAGFGYVYSVRAYDTGHAGVPSMEGGHSSETQSHGQGRISPVVPGTPETNRLERHVRVVPNPYREDDVHQYPGDLKIRFVNLPSKCKIYITTVTGELIDIVYHDDPNTAENHWRQIGLQTEGGRLDFPSGIYFYVVESLTPESLGKFDRGSFIIIR